MDVNQFYLYTNVRFQNYDLSEQCMYIHDSLQSLYLIVPSDIVILLGAGCINIPLCFIHISWITFKFIIFKIY